jgi:hypothetical protein
VTLESDERKQGNRSQVLDVLIPADLGRRQVLDDSGGLL